MFILIIFYVLPPSCAPSCPPSCSTSPLFLPSLADQLYIKLPLHFYFSLRVEMGEKMEAYSGDSVTRGDGGVGNVGGDVGGNVGGGSGGGEYRGSGGGGGGCRYNRW